MKFSLKTLTVLALLVAVHLARGTCHKGFHYKDTPDRRTIESSREVGRSGCMANNYFCKFMGEISCVKCEDG
jgi:hypothetical protein